MEIIYNDIFLKHDTGGMHPENRKRLDSVPHLHSRDIELAEDCLGLVHSNEYIKSVKEFCEKGGGHLDNDTAVSVDSYEAAVTAVGATMMAAQSQDFALVRPPGHHAHHDHASGFCIFNNIAIATQSLVHEGKRVLVFDFDGHLGDGTEKFFYDTDQVLYWSLHQWPAFPGWGEVGQIGEGKGKGFTINVPLPPGSGDDLFWKAMNALLPVAEQFQPDAVAISAGFDAHQFDLLLDLRLTVNTYHKIGRIFRQEFDHIFAALEGGYNIEMFPICVQSFLAGVNGQMIPFNEQSTESDIQVMEEFDVRLGELEQHLSPYWKVG